MNERNSNAGKNFYRTSTNARSIRLYLNDVSNSKSQPLDTGYEKSLAIKAKKGDKKARDELVSSNLRFAISVALEYQGQGIPLEDLFGFANLGLMNAVQRFEPKKGFKFISYAVWWIRQSIHEALSQEVRTIRLPVNKIDLLRKVSRYRRSLEQESSGSIDPRMCSYDVEELAREIRVSPEQITDTLYHSQPLVSLDSKIDERGDNDNTLIDILPDNSQPTPDKIMEEKLFKQDVAGVLNDLDKREAEILRLYFGIGNEKPLTLEEIGTKFKLTRERVRQIKERTLRKLRHPSRRGTLEKYT